MAYIRSLQNGSLSPTILAGCLDPIRTALEYAGFTDLAADISTTSGDDKQIEIHTGETASDSTTLVRFWCIGGDGYLKARANATVATADFHYGLNIKIVATKSAVILSHGSSAVTATFAAIITKDSSGQYVVIVNSNNNNLTNPYIMPHTDDYTALVQYSASTSAAFGCTALSIMPVPSYDGSAKYLPAVAFAHAVQYQVDGSVTLGNQKWYSIGGSWYLLDDETE